VTEQEEFGNIILRTQPDGSVLRVKDVAETELGARSYTSFSRRAGQPATTLVIYQLPGANALDVAAKIRDFMDEAKKQLSPGPGVRGLLRQHPVRPGGPHRGGLHPVQGPGPGHAGGVHFPGELSGHADPLLVVPVSLVGTFATFVAMGFSINTLSLFGLVLAIGSVVDDAIVVVEAVKAHMAEGLSTARGHREGHGRGHHGRSSGWPARCSRSMCRWLFWGASSASSTGSSPSPCAWPPCSRSWSLTLTPALCVKILRPKQKIRGPLGTPSTGLQPVLRRRTAGYLNGVQFLMRRLALAV
jgi:multidrug efflux pump subunit AcrB